MKAFVCVYRHSKPNKAEKQKVRKAAEGDMYLRKFLDKYPQQDCFYDWGDDPAFFAASEFFHDVRYATWGVCRRDVRKQLTKGDLVVYFCGRQRNDNTNIWDYYFIGFGTVKEVVSHQCLWENSHYAKYCKFYNMLIRPNGEGWEHHEPFGNNHDDWNFRSGVSYIFFETSEALTDFNISAPLHVASKLPDSRNEEWRSTQDELVNRLETRLFKNHGITRRLRTKNVQHPHRHIAIHKNIKDSQASKIAELRIELAQIAKAVRIEKTGRKRI